MQDTHSTVGEPSPTIDSTFPKSNRMGAPGPGPDDNLNRDQASKESTDSLMPCHGQHRGGKMDVFPWATHGHYTDRATRCGTSTWGQIYTPRALSPRQVPNL